MYRAGLFHEMSQTQRVTPPLRGAGDAFQATKGKTEQAAGQGILSLVSSLFSTSSRASGGSPDADMMDRSHSDYYIRGLGQEYTHKYTQAHFDEAHASGPRSFFEAGDYERKPSDYRPLHCSLEGEDDYVLVEYEDAVMPVVRRSAAAASVDEVDDIQEEWMPVPTAEEKRQEALSFAIQAWSKAEAFSNNKASTRASLLQIINSPEAPLVKRKIAEDNVPGVTSQMGLQDRINFFEKKMEELEDPNLSREQVEKIVEEMQSFKDIASEEFPGGRFKAWNEEHGQGEGLEGAEVRFKPHKLPKKEVRFTPELVGPPREGADPVRVSGLYDAARWEESFKQVSKARVADADVKAEIRDLAQQYAEEDVEVEQVLSEPSAPQKSILKNPI